MSRKTSKPAHNKSPHNKSPHNKSRHKKKAGKKNTNKSNASKPNISKPDVSKQQPITENSLTAIPKADHKAKRFAPENTAASGQGKIAKTGTSQKTIPTWRLYVSLMRLDRPIGILLLLWPTYWSLWLAARHLPSLENIAIFTLGCVFMRSAGCVINDYADRHFDGHVQRTQHRPLATGQLKPNEALLLFVALCGLSLILVLLTNPLTIKLSLVAVLLAFIYPFTKRYTHMPQVFLGAAFAWSVPMAFAAELGELRSEIFLLYVAVVLWALIYDTFYAMVDRDDDLKIGVKSTAILFGDADKVITALLQGLLLITCVLVGRRFQLSWP